MYFEGNLFNSNKATYETLTHEVYHALTHDEYGYDRIGGINSYTGQYNSSLLEVFVEKAAYRTVYEGKSNDPYWNKDCNGYPNLIFALGMLEATYGVTEQELLEHGIQSRSELADFLAQKVNSSPMQELQFLDKFEANLSQIHQITYGSREEKSKIKSKGKSLGIALGIMESECAYKMKSRLMGEISVSPYDSDYNKLTEAKLEDYMFNFNKLTHIVDNTKKSFSRRHPFQSVNQGYEEANSQFNVGKIKKIITHTSTLVKSGFKVKDEETERIALWTLGGNIEYYDQCLPEMKKNLGLENLKPLSEHGIRLTEINDKRKFEISNDIIERNQEPDRYTDKWENKQIYFGIRNNFIFGELVDKIKKIFVKQTALPRGNPVENNINANQIKETNNLQLKEELKSWDLKRWGLDPNNINVNMPQNYQKNNKKIRQKDIDDNIK